MKLGFATSQIARYSVLSWGLVVYRLRLLGVCILASSSEFSMCLFSTKFAIKSVLTKLTPHPSGQRSPDLTLGLQVSPQIPESETVQLWAVHI